MSILNDCKLIYFDIPGRGEATRLALTIGGINNFTDKRIPFSDWTGELKASTHWGSLPVLQLKNGNEIAQQRAILRFVGKETGLYPTSTSTDDNTNYLAACVDEFMDACEDIVVKTNAVGQGLPQDQKEAARKAACEVGGVTYGMLTKIDTYIADHGSAVAGHVVGDSLTIADLYMYTVGNNLISGLFDGVPSDTLEAFSNIQAVRGTVRSHPVVSKYYNDFTGKLPDSYTYGSL